MSSEELLREKAKIREEQRVIHVSSLQERQVRALERIAENLQLITETADAELNYARKPKKARI